MQKEQNALLLMFAIVIIVCGGFILLKKSNVKPNFLQKDNEQKIQPEQEFDYQSYIGSYSNQEHNNVKVDIISINKTHIEFTIEATDNERLVTVKEKTITKTIDNSYYFEYKDSYNNPGTGRITLSDNDIFLTLDTDIPDSNIEGICIGNYASLKLQREDNKKLDYQQLVGNYEISIEESGNKLNINIISIQEDTLNFKMTYNDTIPYSIKIDEITSPKYSFTYTNETQTHKGKGIIEIKDEKLYLTLTEDETSLEKGVPNITEKELIKRAE